MATVGLDPTLLFLELVFMVFDSYQCGQFKQEFSAFTDIFKILCMRYMLCIHSLL